MVETSAMRIDRSAVRYSVPEGDRASRPLLVLMRGYGSHEDDLFGLAGHLPSEPVIASLRAPIAEAGGNAWWSRTMFTAEGPALEQPHWVQRTAAWVPGHTTADVHVYDGLAHGISPEELSDIAAFIRLDV